MYHVPALGFNLGLKLKACQGTTFHSKFNGSKKELKDKKMKKISRKKKGSYLLLTTPQPFPKYEGHSCLHWRGKEPQFLL